MDILNSNNFNEYEQKDINDNNLSSNALKHDNYSFQKENNNTAYTTNNNINQTNNSSLFERYKNQQLLNKVPNINCNCNCHIKPIQRCHFCNFHNFHIHHIHIPREHLCDILNIDNLSEIKNLNNSLNNSNNLLKEVTQLKNECRKFKEELDRNNNEKYAEDKYIRKLENEINSNYEKKAKIENFNRYHDMLDKSFKVMNSVSNKINDEKGKTKGGVYYYMNKDPEYDQLIQAQKNWIDNIQGNKQYQNLKMNQLSYNQDENNINKYNIGNDNEINNNDYNNNLSNQEKGFNDKKNSSKYYFDSKRNNNKAYIIKKGDKININKENNVNNNSNSENENNYEEEFKKNEILNLNKDEYNNNISSSNNNENIEEKENEVKEVEEEINTDVNNKTDLNNKKDENNKIENNINEVEEKNPFYERFLLIDENGDPILRRGERLLGMELIPLIGEDEKEVIDENGNIILIGPDKQPKSQEDLEPILLDNDIPLVNEENKPFLGLCGIPLINEEGSPVIGPGELYDNDNKVVKGVVGLIAKDNMGNPIKISINDFDNDNDNNDEIKRNSNKDINIENNNKNNDIINQNQNNQRENIINIEENGNENSIKPLKNYIKLKPLMGEDGVPIRDSNQNFILLDDNNIPVKNTGISLLLNESGKPLFNSLGEPILVDGEGNYLNADNNLNNQNQNQKISYNKQFLNYNKIPTNSKLMNNKQKRTNNMKNKRRLRNNEKGRLNYSECNQQSLKKINFMRPNNNPFYDDNEYKVNCFACDVGCSVSKSGYSCMNYSPYNNLIRRRDITPIRNNNGKKKKDKNSSKVNINKIGLENDNNYYLTES